MSENDEAEGWAPESMYWKWAKPVGEFIILMGEIEAAVDELWREISPLEIAHVIAHRLLLNSRIEMLEETITLIRESRPKDVPDAAELLEALGRARGLLASRNIVAHTAPVAAVYVEGEKVHEIVMKLVGKRRKELDMTQLQERISEARTVVSMLYALTWKRRDAREPPDPSVPF